MVAMRSLLHSGPAAVSALAAAGRVVGTAVAVPPGPWASTDRLVGALIRIRGGVSSRLAACR